MRKQAEAAAFCGSLSCKKRGELIEKRRAYNSGGYDTCLD